MNIIDKVDHADFCQPRPGETEPRIESYLAERTNEAGFVIARPRVVRCMECGNQTVTG